MVNQIKTAPPGSIHLGWQAELALLGRQAGPLILHLPDPPKRRFNSPDPQKLIRIAAIAVVHRIDQGLLQPQPELHPQRPQGHRLQQQLNQRCQLQGGWRDEVTPAQRHLRV